ncbi:hypothetical protein BKA67DRAFT_658479 [Truncatella angustata]|uniref:Uncharacterized protein n=1 Tax=Truncatella angustata TaxID=152316 RepID=A0A9P8UKG1_9PEZI|nr:uncharacterized protein BKA67DRAFT_658479 [Truncatella angustata]KAH6654160.1 hypothetical protein BKA67DRAFT_658479 [Truncatella angustata]
MIFNTEEEPSAVSVSPVLTELGGSHSLTPEEIQFIVAAKASGRLGELMALAKDSDSGSSLEEVKNSANDQRELIDSVSKQATTLQSQIERYKSLIESGATLQSQQAEAKHAKLARTRAANARLEEMVSSDDLELKRLISQNVKHIEELETVPNYLKGGLRHGNKVCTGAKYSPSNTINDPFYGNLLEKLQALGWEIKIRDENKQLVKTARYYSSMQVMMSITSLKHNLNLVLMEAACKYASAFPAGSGYARALDTELGAVMEEINSLWDEVVPVAHMAVEKTMLEPILHIVNVMEKSKAYQNAIIGSYIGSCLSFINERLELLTKRIEIAVFHHLALFITHEHNRAFRYIKEANIEHMHTLSHRHMQNDDEPGPEIQTTTLMHNRKALDIFGGFPSKVFDPLTTTEEKVTILNEFIAERAVKENSRLKNLHSLYESSMKAGLHEGASVNTRVLQCIVADSLKGIGRRGAALNDGQTEESLEALQEENRKIRDVQRSLPLPEVIMNKALLPAWRIHLEAIDLHDAGVLNDGRCEHGANAADRKDCDVYKFSLKQAEIIQRWSGLLDSKEE